jgi:hypothetical protein
MIKKFDDIVIDGLRFGIIMEQVKNLERQLLKVEYMMFLFMVTLIKGMTKDRKNTSP